jgi:hypothetical protein
MDNNLRQINKKRIDNIDLFLIVFMIFVLLMMIFILIINLQSKNCAMIYVKKSNIEGEGLFTLKNIKKGDKLFLAIDNYNSVTYMGTKINHCNNPNTELVKMDDGWYVISLYDIEKDTEITIDYNSAPDFIKRPDPSWTC